MNIKVVKYPPKSSTDKRYNHTRQKSYKKNHLSIDLKKAEKSLSENEVYDQVRQYNIMKEFLSKEYLSYLKI
jgi:hypothetical protein